MGRYETRTVGDIGQMNGSLPKSMWNQPYDLPPLNGETFGIVAPTGFALAGVALIEQLMTQVRETLPRLPVVITVLAEGDVLIRRCCDIGIACASTVSQSRHLHIGQAREPKNGCPLVYKSGSEIRAVWLDFQPPRSPEPRYKSGL